MRDEAEKRLHRCSFAGHRPEKLGAEAECVKAWLEEQIDRAIQDGFTTFISGCGMGVDIWAAQIVLRKKAARPDLHLIAATPWPGFARGWNAAWKEQYEALLSGADLVIPVSKHYHEDVFQQRNEWMIDHSSRLIAFYNGSGGGTGAMIEYARKQDLEMRIMQPDGAFCAQREADPSRELSFPESIAYAVGREAVFGEREDARLTPEQETGLAHAIGMLPDAHRRILRARYQEGMDWEACCRSLGMERGNAQELEADALRRLRTPPLLIYLREGYEKAELTLKMQCAEAMKEIIRTQKQKRPQMTEMDVVKLVFQGMLGVGHLVPSAQAAQERLHAEMSGLAPGTEEELIEWVSPDWFRLNLRPAKAEGIAEEEIARMLCESAARKPLSFTRRNVYNFCVRLDGSESMETAAKQVLHEDWLPSHSERYRDAFHPAYRVLHRDFMELADRKNR